MKKLSLFLGMAIAASLSLTNCTEKIEGPIAPATPAGIPFEISADISLLKLLTTDLLPNGPQATLLTSSTPRQVLLSMYLIMILPSTLPAKVFLQVVLQVRLTHQRVMTGMPSTHIASIIRHRLVFQRKPLGILKSATNRRLKMVMTQKLTFAERHFHFMV